MYSNKLYSPLRYPGGKARFAPYIAEVMRCNDLEGGHYLEPYAGGAGVALELLLHGHAEHIHINDLDPAIYDFWRSVTRHSRKLLNLIENTPITIDQWHYWRSVMLREVKAPLVERGFATLFLNRTNRSGILKGGVIGGKSQSGAYKLDARFRKEMITARIEKISEHAKNITVYCKDALSLLSSCADFLPQKSLIYLDPPYYVKGKGLYRNFYGHNDHLKISRLLQAESFKRNWVVSYDNAPEICEMYSATESLTYGLNYTAHSRYIGDEVMFFKESLTVPEMDIPCSKRSA